MGGAGTDRRERPERCDHEISFDARRWPGAAAGVRASRFSTLLAPRHKRGPATNLQGVATHSGHNDNGNSWSRDVTKYPWCTVANCFRLAGARDFSADNGAHSSANFRTTGHAGSSESTSQFFAEHVGG